MIEKVKDRTHINWAFTILLILVVFSNIFYFELEKIFYLKPNLKETNFTQVHFIDVGQGDAIAIKFSNGKSMLIDSGTESYRHKLTNYLDNMIVENDTIDYVVLTHPDSDHSSNMSYIIDKYKIEKFYRPPVYETFENKKPSISSNLYKELILKLNDKGINTTINNSSNVLDIGNAKITWLCPTNYMIDNYTDTNNISPVIIVEENDTKLMLTGDIDSDIEESLINLYGENLDIDILKLAHHGSKYSTSDDFLEYTTPKKIVVSVGENTYGHPANDTIERILEYDEENNTNLYANFYSTKEVGNVIITLNKNMLVQNINNIDTYLFLSYFVFSSAIFVIILNIMVKPYITYFVKKSLFDIHNILHKKRKEKEKALNSQKNIKNQKNL